MGLYANSYTRTDVETTNLKKAVTTTSSSGSTYSQSVTASSRLSITTEHTITDDGETPVGGFASDLGFVNYAGKTISLKVTSDYSESQFSSNYEDAQSFESFNSTSESATGYDAKPAVDGSAGGGGSSTAKGGQYGSKSVSDVYGSNSLVVSYKVAPVTPVSHTETFQPNFVTIDLCPYTSEAVVPGSVKFTWMGTSYVDFEGVLYRGRTSTDPGIASGLMDYTRGMAQMIDYVVPVGANPASFTLDSLWTGKRPSTVANVTFTTQLAPVKPSGIVVSVVGIDGTQVIATGSIDGSMTGTHVQGKMDYETGQCEIQYGDYVLDSALTDEQKAEWWYDPIDVRVDGKIWKPWPVDPRTLRYNFVSYFYLPLDANILGLDPVRLPQDGRVPIFRPGGFAVIGHTDNEGPLVAVNGATVDCGRERLSRVRVIGNDGVVITSGYTVDLDAGILTWTDVSGFSQPVVVEHRVEDMAMVSDVQIDGTISFTRAITHEYPTPGSYVSSAMVTGDLRSRVSVTFDQATWNNVWSDVISGSPATGTFNNITHPIVVTNGGALTERWAVVFTNSTSFNVIGEHLGVIASGNTSSDCYPLNPASGTPYFLIPALGWGLGWATGNVVRFNTIGAEFPTWVVRTVQQGPETVTDDSFLLLIRGDVDHP
jgi:hypothetical protein